MKYVFYFTMLIGFIACQSSSEEKQANDQFFDLSNFALDYVEQHLTQDKIKQILTYGDQKEEVVKDTSSLTFLYNLCKKANINNPTLYDKYEVIDTLIDNKEARYYRTKDDQLLVKELLVLNLQNDNAAEEVTVTTSYGNPISETTRILKFEKDGNIDIHTTTINKLSEDIDLYMKWVLN